MLLEHVLHVPVEGDVHGEQATSEKLSDAQQQLADAQRAHGTRVKAIVNLVSFAVILLTLVGGVAASFAYPDKHQANGRTPSEQPG